MTALPDPSGSPAPALPEAELLARTAVIVVSYNSAELLRRNLAPLSARAPEAQVVVVDNRSTDRARQELTALARRHRWSTVLPETNTGFGAGMNLGAARAAQAGAEVLVLLNPDALLGREDLVRLARRAHRCPDALVGPLVRDSSGKVVSDGVVVCLADGSMRSRRSRRPVPPGGTSPWLSGACLALSTGLFERVGGFDARYFLYWEDVDFSARILRAGGRLVLDRKALAVHDEGGTHAGGRQGSRAKSETYYYYNIRNRLLYAALHLERAGRRRWLLTAGTAAREIVLRGGRRQFLTSLRPLATALAATRDGYRLLRAAEGGTLPDPALPVPRTALS